MPPSIPQEDARHSAWPARGRLVTILCLAALALGIRLYRINVPPLDYHPTRQYISANIARGLYLPHVSDAPEWRKHIARINGLAEMQLEPRYMETVVAGLYFLTGGEHLWIGRFLGALVWVAGGVVLYLLALRLMPPAAALLAMIIHLFLPFGVIGSQAFQPDPLMVGAMILSLYAMVVYFDSPSWRRLVAAGLLAAFAISAKPVCAFLIGLSFAGLAISEKGVRGLLEDPRCWAYAALSLAPPAVYYILGIMTNPDLSGQSDKSFILALAFSSRYWLKWIQMIGRVTGWIPAALAVYGIRFLARGRPQAFGLGLWAGYGLYGLTFNYHIHTHDYYSLPLIPVVALTLAPVLLAAGSSLWNRRGDRALVLRLATAAGIVLLIAAAGFGLTAGQYGARKTAKEAIKLGGAFFGVHKKVLVFLAPGRAAKLRKTVDRLRAAGDATNHNLKTACLTDDYGKSVFYHAEVSGPFLHPRKTAEPMLEQCLAAPTTCEYLILRLYDSPALQAQLKGELERRFPIVFEQGDCIVFDLRKPAAPVPSS